MRLLFLFALLLATTASARDLLPGIQRILFLGDSITASGEYVDAVEAYLDTAYPERQWQMINAGLASETVSGLSEDGHAGGEFPRPDLHERLDRVLEKTKPELIFVCYGMNDGIYLPLAEERFALFRAGIEKVRTKAAAIGAKVIHLTPPPFDSQPIKQRTSPDGIGSPFHDYDTVLAAYSEWLLSQRTNGWEVIDVHEAMVAALKEKRSQDPVFRYAGDGVHPNEEGHWVIARKIVTTLEGDNAAAASKVLDRVLSPTDPASRELRSLIRQRGRLLHHAWLTATGHKRPGISPGLPLPEAQAKAAELENRIRGIVRDKLSQ